MLKLYEKKQPELPVSEEESEQALKEILGIIERTFGSGADFIVTARVPLVNGHGAYTPLMRSGEPQDIVTMCALVIKSATEGVQRHIAALQLIDLLLGDDQHRLLKGGVIKRGEE